MDTIHQLISSQVPEHLRTDAPLFVDFLKTYYQYVGERENASGRILSGSLDFDIDTCSADYISKFYEQHASAIPAIMSIDRRNFIKLLSSIYAAKGTEKAIKLLFLAVFSEIITVTHPGDQILKASGGDWISESFFTVEDIFGTAPSGEVSLTFSNIYGDFSIKTNRLEEIDTNTRRIFFNSYNKIELENDQTIFYYDFNGLLTYAGRLIQSPATLKIVHGGADWRVGQVIVIPGSVDNSVARVVAVDVNGAITKLEILEYGHNHVKDQTLTVSPYPNKPSESTTVITSNLVSTSPLAYHHYIDLTDYTEGFSENIQGLISGINPDSYHLEAYYSELYYGTVIFAQSYTFTPPIRVVQQSEVTIEEWLASRATISYSYSNSVKTKGSYRDASGQLSHQEIKLQDSYFYQAFSYLIESTHDISEYEQLMNLVHPAGTKRFSNLSKRVAYQFDFTSERVFSLDTVSALDILLASDILSIQTDKTILDSILLSDSSISRSFEKVFSGLDLVNTSELLTRDISKALTDTTTVDELASRELGKVLTDSASNSEIMLRDLSKVLGTDSVTTSELVEMIKALYRDIGIETVTVAETYDLSLDKTLSTDTVTTSEVIDILTSFYREVLDSVTTFEVMGLIFVKELVDTSITTEATDKAFIKYATTDSVSAYDPGTNSVIAVSYFSETYHSENYYQNEFQLTIG